MFSLELFLGLELFLVALLSSFLCALLNGLLIALFSALLSSALSAFLRSLLSVFLIALLNYPLNTPLIYPLNCALNYPLSYHLNYWSQFQKYTNQLKGYTKLCVLHINRRWGIHLVARRRTELGAPRGGGQGRGGGRGLGDGRHPGHRRPRLLLLTLSPARVIRHLCNKSVISRNSMHKLSF